jgi:hypothetical protein
MVYTWNSRVMTATRKPLLTRDIRFSAVKIDRDSSIGIALGYGLDDRGSRVRFPTGAGNFSFHHCVQNCSGAHPASYPMGTRDSFPVGKAAGAWRWPLTSIQCRGQRMRGAIPPLPNYAFMVWRSLKKSTGTTCFLFALHRVVRWMNINVSEDCTASIFTLELKTMNSNL